MLDPVPSSVLEEEGKGRLERYTDFPASEVAPRNIDVWLPPGYGEHHHRHYPVLYMHDGQNLFVPELSYSGVDWGVHETIIELTGQGLAEAAIVVGLWNTPERIPEYMPQKPMEQAADRAALDRFAERFGGAPISDAYLRFIVEALKPFIDRTYRTKAEVEHTSMMGSSMGGLISLYAICEYPEVFGGAGCLSPSWPIAGRPMITYLKKRIPHPRSHRLYFDYGAEGRLPVYEPYQGSVDRLLEDAGFVPEVNLVTRKFPGAPHSEQAWRERLNVPLQFLLGHHAEPLTGVLDKAA